MTALDELRQALAEWDRLTEAARSDEMPDFPWKTDHQGGLYLGGYGAQIGGPTPQVAAGMAELAVAAVGLAGTVRAILANAIHLIETEWPDWNGEPALSLAQKINEGEG